MAESFATATMAEKLNEAAHSLVHPILAKCVFCIRFMHFMLLAETICICLNFVCIAVH